MKDIKQSIALMAIVIAAAPIFGRADGRNIKADISDTLRNVELQQVEVVSKVMEKYGVTSYNSRQLEPMKSATIGETLSKIPGIQNFSFGPNAGLPMIRSLSGNRVKLMSDGIGLNEMSGISPNMNIDVDQDKIKGLEVFMGSGSVLYGGKAIGGAVNLKSTLIPTRVAGKNVEGSGVLDWGTNSGQRQSFSLTANLGKHWAWHIGGMHHRNKRVKIPCNSKAAIVYDTLAVGFNPILQVLGQVNVDAEHVQNYTLFPYISAFAEKYFEEYELSKGDLYTFDETSIIDGKRVSNKPNPIYVPGQDPVKDRFTDVVRGIRDYGYVKSGEITNSHSCGSSVEGGMSYTSRHLNLGVGCRHSYAYYGIPGYAMDSVISSTHTHADGYKHEVKNISYSPINMKSKGFLGKVQAEWIEGTPLFPYVKFQGLYQLTNDEELLGEKLANGFRVNRRTMRLELHQKQFGILKGMSGLDFDYRTINGRGSQRYIPNNRSSEWGFFTMQHVGYKFLDMKLGYRHDRIRRSVVPDSTYKRGRGLAGGKLSDKHFALHQFHAMVRGNLWDKGWVSASFNHSERAPEVNELYAGNNHFAIVTEENGDDMIGKEWSNSVELGTGVEWKGLRLSLNYYNTQFKNYLYLGHTGVRRNGFVVKEWRGADTKVYGVEAQLAYGLNLGNFGAWEMGSYFDIVKNKDTSKDKVRNHLEGAYMPNMPTSRLGGSLMGKWRKFVLNVNFDRYLKQKFLGKNINPEYAFPPYNLLAARLSYSVEMKPANFEFYLYGKNLLNEEARPQNSLLRYIAPLPGINFGGGVKISI